MGNTKIDKRGRTICSGSAVGESCFVLFEFLSDRKYVRGKLSTNFVFCFGMFYLNTTWLGNSEARNKKVFWGDREQKGRFWEPFPVHRSSKSIELLSFLCFWSCYIVPKFIGMTQYGLWGLPGHPLNPMMPWKNDDKPSKLKNPKKQKILRISLVEKRPVLLKRFFARIAVEPFLARNTGPCWKQRLGTHLSHRTQRLSTRTLSHRSLILT